MESVLSIILIILGGVVALIILIGAGVGILYLADSFLEKHYARGQMDQYRTMKERLASNAYWFGEDEATMNLIQNLSKIDDISTVRDRWREDKLKQSKSL